MAFVDSEHEKKLRSLFREDTAFPGYVFGSSWKRYYFFPSDRLFDGSFVDFAKSLLSLENASTCWVINLSTIVSKENNEEAAVIIRPETSAEQYALDMEEGAFIGMAIWNRYICCVLRKGRMVHIL